MEKLLRGSTCLGLGQPSGGDGGRAQQKGGRHDIEVGVLPHHQTVVTELGGGGATVGCGEAAEAPPRPWVAGGWCRRSGAIGVEGWSCGHGQ
jgi:hypothetical protein